MTEVCDTCGEGFSSLGHHWRWAPSHRPQMTEQQHDIATGLLMGDGFVRLHSDMDNGYLACKMITVEFLEWLNCQFGTLGKTIRLESTPEESATHVRESGFRPEADPNDYSSVFRWRTHTSPEFNRYREWYETGSKRFPDELQLSPMILKVWYCCDGTLKKHESSQGRDRMIIYSTNESDREGMLCSLFEDVGVDDVVVERERVRIGADGSERLFEWMGDPLPGFYYKWPGRGESDGEVSDREWNATVGDS